MDVGQKRVRQDGTNGAGGASKRAKEAESLQSGLGSKTKPCTKFFSTAGCPFGEGCHFLHYVPGGFQAVAQMTNLGGPAHSAPAPVKAPTAPTNGLPTPAVKTKLCNKFNTAEGCKWGDKCHFAHGERDLGKPIISEGATPVSAMAPPMGPRPALRPEFALSGGPGVGTPGNFGTSATAKISVDASLAGAIIGKGGTNTKQICRVTGVRLAIKDHESDANLKNIELEGSFDQIKHASALVRELIVNISATHSAAGAKAGLAPSGHGVGGGPGSNYKTKMCENFSKGSCTFGERCHFAHGASELRKASS